MKGKQYSCNLYYLSRTIVVRCCGNCIYISGVSTVVALAINIYTLGLHIHIPVFNAIPNFIDQRHKQNKRSESYCIRSCAALSTAHLASLYSSETKSATSLIWITSFTEESWRRNTRSIIPVAERRSPRSFVACGSDGVCRILQNIASSADTG